MKVKFIVSCILIFSLIISFPVSAGTDEPIYSVGDILEIGSYPQNEVTNPELKEKLDMIAAEEYSYIFESNDKKIISCCDIEYNGSRYRGVYFEKYLTVFGDPSSEKTLSLQDNNGYYKQTLYWFKYSPLKWRVLDPQTGLLICENIIDSKPYYFADNSNIYTWLNNDFLSNSGLDVSVSEVYLLTENDVNNENYGFGNSLFEKTRIAKGSDYAKCMGLYVYQNEPNKGASHWLLENHFTSSTGYAVSLDGTINSTAELERYHYGVRPAITADFDLLENRFTDVQTDAWYYEAVRWSVDNGYLVGISKKHFEPSTTLSRAMFVTILSRVDNADQADYEYKGIFDDVSEGSWYSFAAEWAYDNNITMGTSDGVFSPDMAVTREQTVVFLRTYAEHCGIDTSIGEYNFEGIDDTDLISDWAYDSFVWAYMNSLVKGTSENTISPRDTATRSQISQILMNFISFRDNYENTEEIMKIE